MIILKITDQVPPDVQLLKVHGDAMYCYFALDPEVIEQRKYDAERLAIMHRHDAKSRRAQAMAGITVTIAAGMKFNADETSQQRMVRAILVMSDTDTLPWTLADNTVAAIRKTELMEALKLSVMQQASLWHIST